MVYRITLPIGIVLSLMLLSKVPTIQTYALYVLNVRLTPEDKLLKYQAMVSPGTYVIGYNLISILIAFFRNDGILGLLNSAMKTFNIDLGQKYLTDNLNVLLANNYNYIYLQIICTLIWAFNLYFAFELKLKYVSCGAGNEKVVKKTLKDYKVD